jgi:hypothetical protein
MTDDLPPDDLLNRLADKLPGEVNLDLLREVHQMTVSTKRRSRPVVVGVLVGIVVGLGAGCGGHLQQLLADAAGLLRTHWECDCG